MKIAHFFIYIACTPLILSPFLGFREAALKSKHSTLHMIQGLLPVAVTNFYVIFVFLYTNLAWKNPAYVIFIGGTYFVLQITILIISTVSKTNFSIFKDFHLSWAMVFTIFSLPLLRLHTCGTINPILNIS